MRNKVVKNICRMGKKRIFAPKTKKDAVAIVGHPISKYNPNH